MRKTTFALVGVAAVAFACVVETGTQDSPQVGDGGWSDVVDRSSPDVVKQVRVESFGGANACADAERYIEDALVNQMRISLLHLVDAWPYGSTGGGCDGGTSGGGDSGGPSSYSETNVQVAGVDEPDIVKTDGARMFALADTSLYAISSWPAQQLAVRSRVQLEGSPLGMFLTEQNRVVVFANVFAGAAAPAMTKVTILDVADAANPEPTRELYVPGYFVDARRVGSAIRLVTHGTFAYPEGVRWSPDSVYGSKEEFARAVDALIVANEALIRAQPLEHWIPSAVVSQAGGQTELVPHACRQLAAPNTPVQTGLVTLATFDEANPALLDRSSVITGVQTIYASGSSLYLLAQHWWWWGSGQPPTTYVHAFDLSRPDVAPYVASGVFDGVVRDSLSVDELDGNLRIAATAIGSERSNRVSVFGRDGGALVELGRTADFAQGEGTQSARFVGDRAFVVTFRQVDPLFAIDLSEATRPVVRGALTVPGFSTYLHPVDATHLLGVGTYVPDPSLPPAGDRAVQLSLFDVSDLSAPRRTWVALMGTNQSFSDAQWDRRAFTWLPERGLFAVPLSTYGWDELGLVVTSELHVFQVDASQGISPVGALSMSDLGPDTGTWEYPWHMAPWVRRGVLADDVAYAVTRTAVRAAALHDLAQPLATVTLGP